MKSATIDKYGRSIKGAVFRIISPVWWTVDLRGGSNCHLNLKTNQLKVNHVNN